jgi:hypothetical protein
MLSRVPLLLAALSLAAVAVLTSGCDTLDPGPETVILTTESTFRFEMTRTQLQNGDVVVGDRPLNVNQDLAGFGFSAGDIVGATIEEIVLERVQPVGVSLNAILSSASVRAAASGQPEVTLGSATSMSAASSQPLTPSNVANLAAMLRAGNAQLRLAPQPGPSLEAQNYVFRVRVRLRVSVEGI